MRTWVGSASSMVGDSRAKSVVVEKLWTPAPGVAPLGIWETFGRC